ncbi:cytochrome d ubiquinol oxidase subunit II [Bradyrhizobium ontarionense]|uniref:Cytochrome d ubiquinol oxidase subunit II n=1 Tax=Bradyrhizobium ontarionense TaxID=2898149 RepID=A0ABY3R7C7_9BRAD|nr:cytochrome d ubiquinol oxidase subunit II [Bradyrhizobium sp. A19]UFZ02726.1 cytochrome d ubiquinol oxidase subunit II [Bradyrhizobium sp. A19]
MQILLDYEILRLIWWVLLGVLLIGFAVMDGFDLGTASVLPFVARTDTERRVAINAIGPVWDGNQVWLILGGGAIFAAWPMVYAAAFSGFYIAMFLVLATLILRPVGFEFRNKMPGSRWRSAWDYALFAGGVVPSLVFGVAIGNLLQGVPFRIDQDLRIFYDGSGLFELLNPFGLLCGLVSLSMLASHGAAYLALKTTGNVADRCRTVASMLPFVTIVLFALAGVWIALGISGYSLAGDVDVAGPSNPLLKTVLRQPGQWLANYASHPWLMAAPALGFLGALGLIAASRVARPLAAFLASAVSIFGIIATAGVSMFPFLMPSSLDPKASLTVWDASSSRLTLFVMLIATLIFLPVVLTYTALVYRVLRGYVTTAQVEADGHKLY